MKESTSIRAYLNLAHDDINYVAINKDNLIKFIEESKIVNYRFSTSRVDSGIELFNTGTVKTLNTAKLISAIISEINLHFKNKFNDFLKTNNFATARIEVIINIYDGNAPSIFLSRDLINKMEMLNLEIEFDIYSYLSNFKDSLK